jgi:hypothetical protein
MIQYAGITANVQLNWHSEKDSRSDDASTPNINRTMVAPNRDSAQGVRPDLRISTNVRV